MICGLFLNALVSLDPPTNAWKESPKTALGKAVNYTVGYWPELIKYTDNGEWPIDNNVAENADLKPRIYRV
jgi:hypothetical protein